MTRFGVRTVTDEEKTDDERVRFLSTAVEQAESDPIHLSIRDLIGLWGAYRRGYWVVYRVERDLAEIGLRTEPSLAEGWIDTEVALVPLKVAEPARVDEVA